MKFDDAALLDKIEDYLAGRLSPKEVAELKQRAAADPEIASTIEFVRLERDGMELILEQNLRADMADWEQVRKPKMTFKVFRSRFLAVAAVMFVAAAIGVWFSTPSGKETFNSILQKTTTLSPDKQEETNVTPSAASPKPDTQYNIALARVAYDLQQYPVSMAVDKSPVELADSLYMAQDYKGAAEVLSKNLAYNQATYKRGHAYFMAGEYENAAADFETAYKERKNMADAQWYWALSLLAQKGRGLNDGTLRQLLLSVNENDNAERYRKARAILDLIEDKPQ